MRTSLRHVARVAALVLIGMSALSLPVRSADLPAFAPPPGWSVTTGDSLMSNLQGLWQAPLPFGHDQFKMIGMWVGDAPMQMMSLSRGRSVASPEAIAQLFPSRDARRGQVTYHVATQRYNFCGQPGTLVNVQFGGLMGFTMAYDLAVTQSRGVSYMLSYIHMAGANDPAAERSLRSLCPR